MPHYPELSVAVTNNQAVYAEMYSNYVASLVNYSNYPVMFSNSVITTTNLSIYGTNFLTHDGSLKVAISNLVLKAGEFDGSLPEEIKLTLATDSLHGLKPGKYNVTILTSGGQTILTNGIQLVDPDAPPETNKDRLAPQIMAVTPREGLFACDNFPDPQRHQLAGYSVVPGI